MQIQMMKNRIYVNFEIFLSAIIVLLILMKIIKKAITLICIFIRRIKFTTAVLSITYYFSSFSEIIM